jgi:deoxyribodipyrimidine photo-lyase
MENSCEPVATLYWFDQDLRLDDNPALDLAIRGASTLLCLYCHDPAVCDVDTFGTKRQGDLRQRFIEHGLDQLSANLQRHGQALMQVSGPATTILPRLIERYQIQRILRSRHFGHFEVRAWEQLQRAHPSVEFIEAEGYTLFTREQVSGIGTLPQTFSKFRRLVERMSVAAPLQQRPFPPPPSLPEALPQSQANLSALPKVQYQGGEAAAMNHVNDYFASQSPSTYKQTRNELDGWSSSSKMSPWLASGCLSVRRLYQRLKHYEADHGANDSTYWLFFELLWREYFQWYALQHAEKLFLPGGINGAKPDYAFDRGRFDDWCKGETRWPLVNACMQQLNQTGYLSNRARQIVASVLVNELALDWRCGAGYFEKQLIDYDIAANWGNWQYIAGVGADPRGGRHFSIEKQAQQFDADGRYVASWLTSHRRPDRTGSRRGTQDA